MKNKTIVIDFPWTVKNNLTNLKFYRTGKEMPYKMMSDKEIICFPIDNFADEQCDLFMWGITNRMPFIHKLTETWNLMQEKKKLHWKFVDFFAWDKEIGVPVNGVYRRAEWIFYFNRGAMGINKKGDFIPSIFREKGGKHSSKLNLFYEILKKSTQESRIDIFARKRHDGFEAWGDQVEPMKQKILS
ncbi:MAG: hypothetical protein HRO68_07650 [Nitrosopumilus sp.]|nr:hypothetical protein [Nitrosopumilus sp.]